MPEKDTLRLTRIEALVAAAGLVLLAVAVVRLAVPDRSRMRPLSIEGITIKSQPIGQAETTHAEATWGPPEDVYIVGWAYHVGAAPGILTLIAPPGDTVLMRVRGGSDEIRPQFVAAGAGYRLRKEQQLRARLDVTNTGPAGETHGAIVLVYYVPVEGN
jgi:hypothetical protein